jgi:drug/metabolite transporter (DMT)-like permease
MTGDMVQLVKRIDVKVLLAFAAVYLIWGTTYLAIKIGVEHMPPFIMASIRYLIAGVLLLGFCYAKRKTIGSKDILRQLILGAFMLTLGQGILFWAELYIPSGLTAVFIATLPVWYILIDARNRKKYPI